VTALHQQGDERPAEHTGRAGDEHPRQR
jgi:hypothetical protein